MRWLVFVLVIFTGYSLLLIGNAYKSQEQLRAETDARIVSTAIRQAALINGVLKSLQTETVRLAESPAVTTYLINKDLGMSPQYGLNASLAAINLFFKNYIGENKKTQNDGYRIVFFDERKTPLVDTKAGASLPLLPIDDCSAPNLIIDQNTKTTVSTSPVLHKSKHNGCIAIFEDETTQLFHYFMPSANAEAGRMEFLVSSTDDGGIILSKNLNDGYSDQIRRFRMHAMEDNKILPIPDKHRLGIGNYDYVVKTNLPDFPYAFATLLDSQSIYGHITPKTFLYAITFVPFIVLSIAFYFIKMREKNALLEEKYAESDKQRFMLMDQNISLSQDIAHREAIEKELREKSDQLERMTEKLRESIVHAEEATKAKSQFLAAMSHEIRTPMNGIIGMTELALESGLTPEQHEYIDSVKVSADSLLTIINDILDFSKIEAGKMSFEAISFNIRHLIEELVKPLYLRAHESRVDFLYFVDDNVPCCLIGDPVRLRQILLNLLSNALKFTKKGYVKLSVRVRSDTLERTRLVFIVEDTGIGIPKSMQSKIFEAFSQADNSTTRRFGGTGLGLTISMKLIQGLGGTIELNSEIDQGSVFTATIPYAIDSAAPVLHDDTEATQETVKTFDQPLTILLAEDLELNQKIMRMVLGKMGHQVTIVENGQEAIEMLEKNRFDVVLMDMQMPVMGGLEATVLIRKKESERSPAYHTPIYALTADALLDERQKGLAAGLDGYMTKPFSKRELASLFYKIASKNS